MPLTAAVLIHKHGEVDALLLHILEQVVCLHGLRHKPGLLHCICHDILPALVLQAEIVLCVEHAHNVLLVLVADRIVGVSGGVDERLPLLHILVQIQAVHIHPVGTYLFHGNIIKLEYIADHLALLAVDISLGVALHKEHTDLLLRHLLLLFLRVDVQETQHPVGGFGQQEHKGGERLGHPVQETRQQEGELLRLLHGDTLWH